PLDHLPLYVRAGRIVPSTIAMNHTGEKPWDPLRFDIYPDAAGNAAGSLYEDDGLSPAYKQGAFRRTTLSLAGRRLALGVDGSYRPPARQIEIALHGGVSVRSVVVDGNALQATGWSRDAAGVLLVRLPDDQRSHTIEFR